MANRKPTTPKCVGAGTGFGAGEIADDAWTNTTGADVDVVYTVVPVSADGCEGARLLKKAGATIWAQNRDSCTIYGMPQAVVKAGLADAELDLSEFGPLLAGGRR